MKRVIYILGAVILCLNINLFAQDAGAEEEEEDWEELMEAVLGDPDATAITNDRHLLELREYKNAHRGVGNRKASELRMKAFSDIQRFKRHEAQLAASSSPKAVVTGNAWQNIGPSPIFNGQTSGSWPVSGRIGCLIANPTNANHWLLGGALGGLWETFNAGVNWQPRTDDQASLAIGAIAWSPSKPSVIYAGTGEAVFSADAYSGAGVLKSTNGGLSWQLIGTTFSGTSFSEMRIHPTNENLVVAATGRGVYRTVNGGANWSQTLSGTATDIEVNSQDFNLQYCALGAIYGSGNNGIYRSTNGGVNWSVISGPWTSLTGGVGRVELALSPSSPSTIYAMIQDQLGNGGSDGNVLGVWRSDDAWTATPTWTQMTSPSGFGNLWYNNELLVDLYDSNIVFAAAQNVKRWDAASAAWTDITGLMHVDFHALAWAGTNRLLLGSDGGCWSSLNRGTNTINHNTNLVLTQFYHGTVAPAGNIAIGGTQDNGTPRWTGSNGWRLVIGGDGADTAIATSNPSNWWAMSYQNLDIQRTRNGGSSTDSANGGIESSNRPFICRFEKSPNDDNIFITGTRRLYKTTNFFTATTVSWDTNSADIGNGIAGMAFAPSDLTSATYAFGASGGTMRMTTNAGVSWTDLDPSSQVPGRTITSLAFNPTNADILYCTLSGFDGTMPRSVYRTLNARSASATWANISPPVDLPVHSIVVDGDNPDNLWVGCDIGVWRSTNNGANWTHMGPEVGLPNVAVHELSLANANGRLFAFTHGRGAFQLIASSAANISVAQRAPGSSASVGCDFTYFCTVSNGGPVNATSVLLTNQLPAQVSFASATLSQGGYTINGGKLVCNLGTLLPQTAANVTIVVHVNSAGSLTNIASAAGVEADPELANNSATNVVPAVVDTTAPQITSVSLLDNLNTFRITYSEPVFGTAATNPANYLVADGAGNTFPITNVLATGDGVTFDLTGTFASGVAPLAIVANGIADCAGNTAAGGADIAVPLNTLYLVSTGSVWKYLDNGTDQGVAWRGLNFNDNAWASGRGQLGYGDGDEATIVGYGPNSSSKYITTYFRKKIVIGRAADCTNLVLNLLRDDGAVVYINSNEVWRSNMPVGTIGYLTPASTALGAPEESTFYATNISPSRLVDGTNIIAVEIHQSGGTSTDLSFDLEVIASFSAGQPRLAMARTPTNAIVTWPRAFSGYTLQQVSALPPANWTPAAGTASPSNGLQRVLVSPSAAKAFLRLQHP